MTDAIRELLEHAHAQVDRLTELATVNHRANRHRDANLFEVQARVWRDVGSRLADLDEGGCCMDRDRTSVGAYTGGQPAAEMRAPAKVAPGSIGGTPRNRRTEAAHSDEQPTQVPDTQTDPETGSGSPRCLGCDGLGYNGPYRCEHCYGTGTETTTAYTVALGDDHPNRRQVHRIAREEAEDAVQRLVYDKHHWSQSKPDEPRCTSCGGTFDSPPCQKSPDGRSGHTYGGGCMAADT